MIPVLFELGPLKVHSYGLMLGIAFILGNALMARDFKRRGWNPSIAGTITIIAVVSGLLGAKALHLIENWDEFLRRPSEALSPGGLTWYGGFLLGLICVIWYVRRKGLPLQQFLDILGVALVLSYGVGRIGCHLSGDGDYGAPTRLPWGTIYAQGIAKPTYALAEYFLEHPDERAAWNYDSLRVIPAGIDRMGHAMSRFDEVTPLHPAPIYEFLLGIIGYGILLALRKRPRPDGAIFMIYLMIAALFRFLVEFLRLNPRLALGLSEAQLFSVLLFVAGAVGLALLTRRSGSAGAQATA
jgi:phosphatidylglycerol---prolipoprotein diacylglyceryl transferase